MTKHSADALRVRLKYKRLILLGKIDLPPDEARAIVGPDCAYHLYFTQHKRRRRSRCGPTGPPRRSRRNT